MPRVDLFPHNATSITEKGYTFAQVALTVKEALQAKDGTSKAGKPYHLPPRVKFVEDPSGEDWMWKVYDDSKEAFGDYTGVLPVAGDVVNVKLKAAFRGGEGSGEFFRDISELYLSMSSATGGAETSVVEAPPPPSGSGTMSILERLSTAQQIAGTALNKEALPLVWERTDEKFKEELTEFVMMWTRASMAPSMLQKLQENLEAKDSQAPEEVQVPEEVASAPDTDDLTNEPEEEVTEVAW